MRQRIYRGILMCLLVFTFITSATVSARAKPITDAPRVLLAYDSENQTKDGQVKIDAIQRLLTSLNVEVHTIRIDQYHAGDIKPFSYTHLTLPTNSKA